MNKHILSVKLMFLLCLSLQAQKSDIQITVYSEDENEPLIGATVYFDTLEKGAITNFDGIAEFTEIPNGQHSTVISFLGFQTLETTIQVPSDSDYIFKLKVDANVLDEVVLQSTRSTRTVKKIPTRIEFIGVEELGEKAIMNPTNISMVLRESTGIQMQQTSLSSGSTNIRIQGLDGQRMCFIVNEMKSLVFRFMVLGTIKKLTTQKMMVLVTYQKQPQFLSIPNCFIIHRRKQPCGLV